MNTKKSLLILLALIFFCSISLSEENMIDCSNLSKWNFAKKLECKLKSITKPIASKIDESTEGITSKNLCQTFSKKRKSDFR